MFSAPRPPRKAEATRAWLTFTRSSGTTCDLAVHYSISGNAIAGDVYELLSGTLIIPDGSISADVDVIPRDDNFTEDNENVTLQLDRNVN